MTPLRQAIACDDVRAHPLKSIMFWASLSLGTQQYPTNSLGFFFIKYKIRFWKTWRWKQNPARTYFWKFRIWGMWCGSDFPIGTPAGDGTPKEGSGQNKQNPVGESSTHVRFRGIKKPKLNRKENKKKKTLY